MLLSNTPIAVTYTNAELRTLVEEFIFQQKKEFTFKSLCSSILYWAMEEGKTDGDGSTARESNEPACACPHHRADAGGKVEMDELWG